MCIADVVKAENLQLVCRFINFWKQASDDGEFRRLMNIVRGVDLGDGPAEGGS